MAHDETQHQVTQQIASPQQTKETELRSQSFGALGTSTTEILPKKSPIASLLFGCFGWNEEEVHVFTVITLQSFSGLIACGLFYGWASINEAINLQFVSNPEEALQFQNQHGIFGAVIILFLGAAPMSCLQYLVVDRKLLSEYHVQFIGTITVPIALYLGAISFQFQQLWLYYIGCTVPAGLGGLCVYRRLVFNHQLWYKHIHHQNLGSGMFGFCIGVWTVVFFVVSIPMLTVFSIDKVMYIYATVVIPFLLYPLITIQDFDIDIEHEERTRDIVYADVSRVESRYVPNKHVAVNFEDIYEEKEQEDEVSGTKMSKDEIRQLFEDAKQLGIDCDVELEDFKLSFYDMLLIPQTWMIMIFFTTLLTPGWGIKLGSYSILRNLFSCSLSNSAMVTSVYVSFYAIGRLFSGIVADIIGLFRTLDAIIIGMFIFLVILPETSTTINHDGPTSSGAKTFVILLWMIGLMYGGSIALFYSVVFDVFGKNNYKPVFSLTVVGFGFSVIIGGLSSAYSFTNSADISVTALSSRWFYAMAGGLVLALLLLHLIKPVQYIEILRRKIIVIQGNRSNETSV